MLDPERKIGGSVIPKILGRSKWGTPLDAYLELRKEKPETADTTEDQDRGKFLEPALRAWAEKKTGLRFFAPKQTMQADWTWATYSPDGLPIAKDFMPEKTAAEILETAGVIALEPGAPLLEIKSPRFADGFEWGEPGTDEVPEPYLLQVSWGMMVTGRPSAIIAALIGGELRIYNIARNPDLEAKMLAQAKRFVDQHVIPGAPPPPGFGDDAAILARYPRNEKPAKKFSELTVAERDLFASYLVAYKNADSAERVLEAFEPAVKDLIADTAGVERDVSISDFAALFPPGHVNVPTFDRVDWKRNKPSIGVGEAYKIMNELLERLTPEEAAAIQAKHMPKEGPRVLKPYFTNPKKKV